VIRWHRRRQEYKDIIIQNRLGLRGIRPFGGQTLNTKKGITGQGSRISKTPPEKNKKIPLLRCFIKVKKWFENERLHNQEVRRLHILQRLKFQMEHDRDTELVLKQHEDKRHTPWYLQALESRLQTLQIHNETKVQRYWFDQKVTPRVGAVSRKGQRKSQSTSINDGNKFELTTQGVDFAVYLVAKGTVQDLIIHVGDPEDFIENRKDTAFVVLDETALWLKCRGEEQVYQSATEVLNAAKRRNVKTACRKAETRQDKQDIQDTFKMWCVQNVTNPDDRDMIDQWYHAGGDKHRITLVNISQVEGWWNLDIPVTWGKKVEILLVFSSEHVRAEDINDDHRFNKTVTVETSEGPVTHQKGEFTRLLWPYIEWRKQGDNAEAFKYIRIWGQMCAWVDTQVNVWLADILNETFKQAVLMTDCLTSRWSPASLLGFWSNQVILVPYAPDSGAFLQEPDTHEHAQLKADIRYCKVQMQFDLEAEAKQKNNKNFKMKWGPHEYVGLLSQGLERFKIRNPLVPIQGIIQIKLLEECTEESTRALLAKPGLERYPPSKGVADAWARARDLQVQGWPEGKPPKPDWEQLKDAPVLVQDDLPEQPEPDDLVFELDDFNDLQLSDHQKIMLLPVDARISQVIYPNSIQARVAASKVTSKRARKSQWIGKFKGHYMGKLATKWTMKANKTLGIKSGVAEIMKGMGPLVIIKKKNSKLKQKQAKKGKQEGDTGNNSKGFNQFKAKPTCASQLRTVEAVKDHPDMNKHVRVHSEGAGARLYARAGLVTSVFQVKEPTGEQWLKYVVMEDGTKANQFHIDSKYCRESSLCGKTKPLGAALDWRQVRGAKLESIIAILGAKTAPDNLEKVVENQMIEHSTLNAGLVEINERLQLESLKIRVFSAQECVGLGFLRYIYIYI